LVYFKLKNRTWRQHFYKRPKKKQLYRQEVPVRRSKIYTNNKFPGKFRISGGIPPAVWKKHWSVPDWTLLDRTYSAQRFSFLVIFVSFNFWSSDKLSWLSLTVSF